jgi:hypothetical protein
MQRPRFKQTQMPAKRLAQRAERQRQQAQALPITGLSERNAVMAGLQPGIKIALTGQF